MQHGVEGGNGYLNAD